MKRLLLLLAVLSLFVADPALAADASVKAMVDGQNKFAIELYQRLDQQPGNLFFSPYSISACMAMTAAGAVRQTRTDMLVTLHLPSNFTAGFADLNKAILDHPADEKPPFEFSIANAVWMQEGQPTLPQFQATVKDDFGGDAQLIDFGNAQNAADKINAWVKKQTHDKIDKLVDARAVKDAKMVLADAIYFKAPWIDRFGVEQTTNTPFALLGRIGVKVPTMHLTDKVRYLETDTYQALALPYADGTMSMVIVLPRKLDGLADVEKNLDKIVPELHRMTETKVAISLPRFKLEQSYDLTKTLSDMGMSRAFNAEQADFSGITGNRSVFIGAVLHRAYVEVDEAGTEAAAVTGGGLFGGSPQPQEAEPVKFNVDHPFLFLIGNKPTGEILFMGRVTDPR